jgi:hypothetical protein
MFVEIKVCYSALFTYLVMWHAGAVSFPPTDAILAQLVWPLSDVMFYLHSGITNLSLYKHWFIWKEMAFANRLKEQHQHMSQHVLLTREALVKGKDQYGWPPYTNKFRSAAFQTELNFFQNNLSYLGGQLYWAIPVSKSSLCWLSEPWQPTNVLKRELFFMTFYGAKL